MSRKFLTNLDLSKNQLIQAAVENLSGAPGSPVKGQLYMNTTDNILYWYNGSGWVAAQGGAGAVPSTTVTTSAVGDAAVVGVATTYAREDHKHAREAFGAAVSDTAFASAKVDGTAVTVSHSDHTHGNPTHDAAAHSAISLSAFTAPTGAISMGGQTVTNVGTPSTGTDATNKTYVDNLTAGLSWKEAARAALTTNRALTALTATDGVTLAANDRVLLMGQTTPAENGLWLAQTGAWTRPTDYDAAGEAEGAAAFVLEGTLNGDKAYVNTTNAPITVGTTGTVWVQFGGGAVYTAGNGLTLTTNDFNVIGDTSIVVTADLVTRGALTGDVTAAQSNNATTIANDVVSNTKLANMNAHTFKGNNTASAADPIDLTIAQMQAELGVTTAVLDAAYLKRFAVDCAANVLTTVTHNFNTRDVNVEVYRTTTPWDTVDVDVERSTVNTVEVRFATAPTAGAFRIVVAGIDA